MPVGPQAQTACAAIKTANRVYRDSLALTRRGGYAINNAETPSVQPGWYTDPWNLQQLRYFDGHQWTGNVVSGGSCQSPPVNELSRQQPGYPLGERLLYLSPVIDARDGDMSCTVQTSDGNRLGFVQPHTRIPSIFGRNSRTLNFGLMLNNGVPIFGITRFGGFGNQRVRVHDAQGNFLGQLRQTTSYVTEFRTARLAMQLEVGEHCFARTEFYVNPSDSYADPQQHVYDSVGSVIATISRRRRATTPATSIFDYGLETWSVRADPLPSLLFATVFTAYLLDRLAHRGLIDTVGYWISRPTWHREDDNPTRL
ncbi:DUF2510 domain-containing protein [Mycobacterium sp. LTG2003]